MRRYYWLLMVLPLLLLGCTVKQQLLSLDAASRTMALGRQLLTEKCNEVKDGCIAAKDLPCAKLVSCEKVEKQVYLGTATGQIMAETAAAVIKAGDKGRGAALLVAVVKRLDELRKILAGWGVQL